MSGSYWDAVVRCPFFRNAERRQGKIRCEGLTEKSNVVLQYHQRQQMDVQIHTFCCDRYENCEIYHAIMEAKYQD